MEYLCCGVAFYSTGNNLLASYLVSILDHGFFSFLQRRGQKELMDSMEQSIEKLKEKARQKDADQGVAAISEKALEKALEKEIERRGIKSEEVGQGEAEGEAKAGGEGRDGAVATDEEDAL